MVRSTIMYNYLIPSFYNFSGNNKVATKLICYTRSTPSIHQLPAVHPRRAFSSTEELLQSNKYIEDLICDKV